MSGSVPAGSSLGDLMSDDEVSFGMTVPLDSDGFLRRECPTCEREFKWRPSEAEDEEDVEPDHDVGYFCPYCGVQAPVDSWFTQAQLDFAQNIVAREFIEPMVSRVGTYDAPDKLDPLTEVDDMTVIVFPCHRGCPEFRRTSVAAP
jgi:hypothetical protein